MVNGLKFDIILDLNGNSIYSFTADEFYCKIYVYLDLFLKVVQCHLLCLSIENKGRINSWLPHIWVKVHNLWEYWKHFFILWYSVSLSILEKVFWRGAIGYDFLVYFKPCADSSSFLVLFHNDVSLLWSKVNNSTNEGI